MDWTFLVWWIVGFLTGGIFGFWTGAKLATKYFSKKLNILEDHIVNQMHRTPSVSETTNKLYDAVIDLDDFPPKTWN